jgi:hypothetical protein
MTYSFYSSDEYIIFLYTYFVINQPGPGVLLMIFILFLKNKTFLSGRGRTGFPDYSLMGIGMFF